MSTGGFKPITVPDPMACPRVRKQHSTLRKATSASLGGKDLKRKKVIAKLVDEELQAQQAKATARHRAQHKQQHDRAKEASMPQRNPLDAHGRIKVLRTAMHMTIAQQNKIKKQAEQQKQVQQLIWDRKCQVYPLSPQKHSVIQLRQLLECGDRRKFEHQQRMQQAAPKLTAVQEVRNFILENMNTATAMYRVWDADGDGSLDQGEIHSGLGTVGMDLEIEELHAVMTDITGHPEPGAEVSFADWSGYVGRVQAAGRQQMDRKMWVLPASFWELPAAAMSHKLAALKFT